MEHSQRRLDLLAAGLKAGDHNAAVELVEAYYEQMYLFMRRLGHNRQTSEDLTQETFLQAWQHIGQLRNGAMLNSWIYRIASNVSKRQWRTSRDEEILSSFATEGSAVSDADLTSADSAGNIEQLYMLSRVVAALPRKLKQAIVLHYMQHLTIADAAEAAGIRQGTYKSRLNRAIKLIKNQLAEKE